MKTEGTNLLLRTMSVFWSSSRWPLATSMSSRRQRSIPLGGYRQVSLYLFVSFHGWPAAVSLRMFAQWLVLSLVFGLTQSIATYYHRNESHNTLNWIKKYLCNDYEICKVIFYRKSYRDMTFQWWNPSIINKVRSFWIGGLSHCSPDI